MKINSLVKETTSMAVYRNLSELILAGYFEPGEWIRERQIKDLLGVSSTPIREALRMLVHEDILESIPHQGVRLRKLTVKQIRDYYEFRVELEGLAAALAAENGTDSDFKKMEQVLLKTEKALLQNDVDGKEFINYNNEFHHLIAKAGDNHVLMNAITQIQTKINMFRVYSWYKENEERPKTTLQQHRLIFKAITSRNPKLARKKIQEHILDRLEHELEMEKAYVKNRN